MEGEKQIEHAGVVKRIGSNTLTVEILSKSACSGCSARSMCSSAEQRTKEVEVQDSSATTYSIGESVTIVGAEKLGIVAVVLCYVVPVLLIVSTMAIAEYKGLSDVTVGLYGLGILIPYFGILYLFREKMRNNFVFKIKKIK